MSNDGLPAPRRPIDTPGLLLSLPLIAGVAVLYLIVLMGFAVTAARLSGLPALRPLAALIDHPSLSDTGGSWLAFLVGNLLYVSVAASILTVARWWGGRGWAALVAWRPWDRGSLRWILGLLGAALVYGAVASLALSRFEPDTKGLALPAGNLPVMILSFILVVVLAPITEELLFRGWIYTAIRPRWGTGSAIGATSTIFALLHWERTHIYALVVFPIGCLLGLARERCNSVRASMLMHAVYNAAGWLATVLAAG